VVLSYDHYYNEEEEEEAAATVATNETARALKAIRRFGKDY
jgi:hypothetical protein